MKKSKCVLLGAVFIAGVAACHDSSKKEWVAGYGPDGQPHDTVLNNQGYRYYNGGWYPVYHNLICPGYYRRPYTYVEICSPGFAPGDAVAGTPGSIAGVTTGGFGSSGAHAGGGADE